MKKSFCIIFTLFLLILSLTSTVSAEDTIWGINDFLNNIDNGTDYTGYNITILAGEANVSRSHTISASNITIKAEGIVAFKGNETNSYFNITGSNIKLQGITFINFDSSSDGGAILISGEYGNNIQGIDIQNCTFTNNTASQSGGAIYAGYTNNINISDCTFENNVASISGGAFYFSDSDNIRVHDCIFTNNTANNYAGAIVLRGNNYTIFSSIFMNNNAAFGGAIYVFWDSYNSTIKDCNFTNNTATTDYGSGGAIEIQGESSAIKSCNFINNTAYYMGGAIRAYNAHNNNVTDCTFINNNGSTGGALLLAIISNFTMMGCKFDTNMANSIGGAIYTIMTTNITIKNCNFTNNSDTIGSTIYLSNIESLSNNTVLINNKFIKSESTKLIKANVYNNNTQNLNIIGGEGAIICNEGVNASISSPVNVLIQGNETEDVVNGTKARLYAQIFTGSTKNYIVGENLLNFTIKDKYVKGNLNDTIYTAEYLVNGDLGDKISVSGNCAVNGINIKILNGTLNIKGNTTLNMTVNNVSYGEDLKVTVNVSPNVATGSVTIYINDEKINTTELKNGVANFDIKELPVGDYNITAVYKGDDKYINSINKTRFSVRKAGTDLSITIATDDSTTVISLNLTDINGDPISGNVTVNVTSSNGYKFNNTIFVEKGHKELVLYNLPEGSYNITALFNATEDYESSYDNCSFEIAYSPSTYYLNSSNVVKYYRNGTQYVVKLTDQYGNPVANQTILITLNCSRWSNLQYNITTNASGIATLDINLIAGKYSIMASYMNATSEINNITVLEVNRVLAANDVVKYYCNSTHYEVTVTSQFGYVLPNEIVTVKVYSERWLKPVKYNIKTNESGIAILPIYLLPGIYSITATIDKSSKYNNVAILPTLTANNLVKKTSQAGNLTARLVDGQGNPVEGKEVKFTVKTKTYSFKTNSDGIATLPIHLGLGTWSFLISSDNAQTRATVKVTR